MKKVQENKLSLVEINRLVLPGSCKLTPQEMDGLRLSGTRHPMQEVASCWQANCRVVTLYQELSD